MGVPSNNESYMNYTRQLLEEIGTKRKIKNDDDDDQVLDEFVNFENNEFLQLEYPESFWHLMKILWNLQEIKAFALSNPDGYFYLLYLRTIIKFLIFNFFISGATMISICYYSNKKGQGDLHL